ncbi:hypothetical protein COO60DRAFT_1544038, partial [Scenedesmus sp. NREL 46B-D3]
MLLQELVNVLLLYTMHQQHQSGGHAGVQAAGTTTKRLHHTRRPPRAQTQHGEQQCSGRASTQPVPEQHIQQEQHMQQCVMGERSRHKQINATWVGYDTRRCSTRVEDATHATDAPPCMPIFVGVQSSAQHAPTTLAASRLTSAAADSTHTRFPVRNPAVQIQGPSQCRGLPSKYVKKLHQPCMQSHDNESCVPSLGRRQIQTCQGKRARRTWRPKTLPPSACST